MASAHLRWESASIATVRTGEAKWSGGSALMMACPRKRGRREDGELHTVQKPQSSESDCDSVHPSPSQVQERAVTTRPLSCDTLQCLRGLGFLLQVSAALAGCPSPSLGLAQVRQQVSAHWDGFLAGMWGGVF